MNRIADLLELEERISGMEALVLRQEACLERLRELRAEAQFLQTAERLLARMDEMLRVAESHRAVLIGMLDSGRGLTLKSMQAGMAAPAWHVEDLPMAARSGFHDTADGS